MRLVFMGTPAFAVPTLKALCEAGHNVVAVYTQPPRPAGRGQKEAITPVHQFALEQGLPVYTPESLKSLETQAVFAAHNAEIAIVAAYGLLLPKPVLGAYPLGCINVHPSLLPRWRGAAPIQRSIMAGDRETGICIMQMDAGLDTGDILMTETYPLPEGSSYGMLHEFLSEKAGPMIVRTLEGLRSKTITPVKQADTGVEYAKKITKEETQIDWNKSAEHIYHHILGLNPFPGAHFGYGGEIIKIFDATIDTKASEVAGTITDTMLGIACGSGVLHPTILQRPGKKRMPVAELLHGFSIPVGTTLI